MGRWRVDGYLGENMYVPDMENPRYNVQINATAMAEVPTLSTQHPDQKKIQWNALVSIKRAAGYS